MDLALGRAGADRPPRDGVGDVLRRDRVEELAADGQPELDHGQEQAARPAQARVHVARVVEVRVVDHPLPPRRRARLLEVDAHHDQEVFFELPRLLRKAARVVARRLGVVNGARADDHEEPVVLAVEDRRHLLAAADHELRPGRGQRQLVDELRRARQRLDLVDPAVANPVALGWHRRVHALPIA